MPVRRQWRDCAGIEGLPRILVLDRAGIVRHDVRPHELSKLVRALVAEGTAAK